MKAPTPNWTGETVVVVCAGPSLSDEQLGIVKQAKVKTIGVNTTYFYLQPDVVYAGDLMFWKVHLARIKAQCPKSQLWTTDSGAAERYQLNRQRGGNRDGLGLNVIHMNGNSGMQALNLAFLWGSRRILLLGMDMREIGGKKHRHGDHEKGLVQSQCFDEWIKKAEQVAKDCKTHSCEVINATPNSALPWFPFKPIDTVLI